MSGDIVVPVTVTSTQIETAVRAAVEARTDEIMAEFKRTLAAKTDELRTASQGLEDRVTASRDRVDTKIKAVDDSLEKLQTKVNTRVSTYVIPAVLLTFVSIVLAVFTAVGGFGVIKNIDNLKTQVGDAHRTFNSLTADLALLKAKVAVAISTADADRFAQLEKKIKEQQDRLDAYDAKAKADAKNRAQSQTTPHGQQPTKQ